MSALTMTLLPEPVAPGDEQVRHLGEVDRLGLAGHVAAEGEGQLRSGRLEVELLEDPAQGDDVEVLVRDLDADRALARDGRLDPERARGERHRQVVRQGLDPAELDVGRRLDLVLGDDRARRCARRSGPGCRSSASFLTMMSSTSRWALSSPPAWSGMAMSSRIVDRRQDVLDPVLGRRRVACRRSRRTGRAADGAGTSVAATAPAGPRAGAKVAEFGAALGTAAGMDSLVVAPGAGLAGRRAPRATGLAVGRVRAVAAAMAASRRRPPAARPRRPVSRSQRRRRGRAHPAGGAHRRPGQLPERDPEADDDADDRQRDEQDERPRRREQVGQRAGQGIVRAGRPRRPGSGPPRRVPA